MEKKYYNLANYKKGIREKAKKIGSKTAAEPNREERTECCEPVSKQLAGVHLPQHIQYKLGDIFTDLLVFAAEHLDVGGNLVFWLPVYLEIDRSSYT